MDTNQEKEHIENKVEVRPELIEQAREWRIAQNLACNAGVPRLEYTCSPEGLDGLLAEFAESREPAAQPAFKCKARSANMGANDPQECDWPMCECDPYADKVIAALQESGYGAAQGEWIAVGTIHEELAEMCGVVCYFCGNPEPWNLEPWGSTEWHHIGKLNPSTTAKCSASWIRERMRKYELPPPPAKEGQ